MTNFKVKPLLLSGKEVLPLVEGGKGIGVSNGESSGAWAFCEGVGTFSAVNADARDEQGNLIPMIYRGKTRRERHEELIAYSIKGGVTQARIAHEMAGGKGRIHMNVLWEMAAVEEILNGVLSQVQGLVHGITCGAGMPYRVAQIAVSYGVYYYPIVSSARAFRALWRRAYHRWPEFLGGVVYEDPWLAGGHNGLSNTEDPYRPEDPYPRVAELRQAMNEYQLGHVPVIMAGGVWNLKEWQNWFDNPEIGPIAFQFGTRPLLTKESPISQDWKRRLLTLKKGDVFLNRFSPTGFYSSAVRNSFLNELQERSERQIAYTLEPVGDHDTVLSIGARAREVYITHHDKKQAVTWINQGYTQALRTPDSTLIFVTPEKAREIHKDQVDCMGCLSACLFSNWAQSEEGTTGRKPDPRSYCIQKTLQDISHEGSVEHNLMFAGHNAFRFGTDPLYCLQPQDHPIAQYQQEGSRLAREDAPSKMGYIPSVRELVTCLERGL